MVSSSTGYRVGLLPSCYQLVSKSRVYTHINTASHLERESSSYGYKLARGNYVGIGWSSLAVTASIDWLTAVIELRS